MTTLSAKALLAPKIRLGRFVLYFYMISIIAVGILGYYTNH